MDIDYLEMTEEDIDNMLLGSNFLQPMDIKEYQDENYPVDKKIN